MTITLATDLREQADLDPMDFLNFLTAVHQRLAVDIPDADAGRLATLDGAIDYLLKALSSGTTS